MLEQTGCILLVEDEMLIRMIAAEALREAGHRVIEAANGDEALALLNSELTIDAVLTDVRMPGQTDGFEVARASKELVPSRPVAILSTHLDRDVHALVDALLQKPYKSAQLVGLVERLLGGTWNGRRKLKAS